MLRKLLALSLLSLSFTARGQQVLYVDSSVTASGIGTTWPAAYKTLREALLIANAGNTSTQYVINVAKGTYYPGGQQSPASVDTAFMITRPGVILFGGYPSGGGTRNVTANPTILSGNVNTAASTADNSNHIMVIAGVSGNDSIVLDGLGFMHGSAMKNLYTATLNGQSVSSQRGGALYNINVNAPIIINNCLFANDSAANGGGAIYNEDASPVISNSAFVSNFSYDGGAIYSFSNAYNRIINSTFTGNRADRQGGAISSDRQDIAGVATYQGCTFTGNSAALYGGAIYDYSLNSTPSRFRVCTFNQNRAAIGGALYWDVDSTANAAVASITFGTFTSNRATNSGGGIFASFSRAAYLIDSSTFTDNRATGVGGGLCLSSDDSAAGGDIRVTTFIRDSATHGGGLYSDVSRFALSDSRFLGNWASTGAGLYHFQPSGPSPIVNSIFSGNVAVTNGAGILNYTTLGRVSITNSQITGNKAGLRGAGVYDSLNSNPRIVNVTFADNNAPFGNAVANLLSSNPIVINSILWEGPANNIFNLPGSATTVSYSIVQAGYTGSNNSTSNPFFVAPLPTGAAPAVGGNYRLQGCSPAINTGDNSAVTATTDLDGNARIYNTTVDRGAYEYPVPFPTPITGDSSLCAGNSIQLSNYTIGGVWSSSDTSVVTIASNGVLTGRKVGSVVISYVVSNSCPINMTKNITIDTVNIGLSVSGSTVTANQAGAQYQWLNCLTGHSIIAGQTSQSYTPQLTGLYAVAITRNGCTDTSNCVTAIGTTVPTVSNFASAITYYPNPTTGILTVSSQPYQPTNIRLADLTGKIILQMMPQATTSRLDLSAYPAGMYLLVLSNGTEQHTLKVSVIR